jgi:phage recombination protein Bet
MSDNALTKAADPGRSGFTPEQIQVIKDVIARGVSATELAFFVEVCQQRRLNPFARQIYAIKRWDATLGREVMAIQVSIDGLRLLAERSGKYAGQLGPWWTDDGEHWLEVWLKSTPPKAAKIQVLRKDFAAPITAVALWDSYVALVKQKDGTLAPGPLWRKMAAHMLAKCAEANALRRAFPEETSGLYVAEEMEQADNPDREPVRVIVAPEKPSEKSAQTAELPPEAPPEPQASEEAAEPQSVPAAAPAPKPKPPFIAPTKGQVNLILATARRTGYINGDDAEPLIALLEKARLTRPDKPGATSIEVALDMIRTQLAGARVGGLKRAMENAPRAMEKPSEDAANEQTEPSEEEYEDLEV